VETAQDNYQRSGAGADSDSLIERIILLRQALHGLTADNAALRRELSRTRTTNRSLQAKIAGLEAPGPLAEIKVSAGAATADAAAGRRLTRRSR